MVLRIRLQLEVYPAFISVDAAAWGEVLRVKRRVVTASAGEEGRGHGKYLPFPVCYTGEYEVSLSQRLPTCHL